MKDEKVWDYSDCQIGHPCNKCIKECTFRLDKGADEKENKNERTIEKFEGTGKLDYYRKWRNYILQHAN
jgi:hypothetical protein